MFVINTLLAVIKMDLMIHVFDVTELCHYFFGTTELISHPGIKFSDLMQISVTIVIHLHTQYDV